MKRPARPYARHGQLPGDRTGETTAVTGLIALMLTISGVAGALFGRSL